VIYFATLTGAPEDIRLHPEDHSEGLWLSETELGIIVNPIKGSKDPELTALKKAFSLLKGESLDFAN
jgi:hypothetical protein